MSYHRENGGIGLGATAAGAVQRSPTSRPGTLVAPPPQPGIASPLAPATGGIGMGTILLVGAIGLGGYLLYKRFKSRSSASSSPSPTTP